MESTIMIWIVLGLAVVSTILCAFALREIGYENSVKGIYVFFVFWEAVMIIGSHLDETTNTPLWLYIVCGVLFLLQFIGFLIVIIGNPDTFQCPRNPVRSEAGTFGTVPFMALVVVCVILAIHLFPQLTC